MSLPLWTEGVAGVLDGRRPDARDGRRAVARGPIMETITDTWEWIKDEQPPLAEGWGTTRGARAAAPRGTGTSARRDGCTALGFSTRCT